MSTVLCHLITYTGWRNHDLSQDTELFHHHRDLLHAIHLESQSFSCLGKLLICFPYGFWQGDFKKLFFGKRCPSNPVVNPFVNKTVRNVLVSRWAYCPWFLTMKEKSRMHASRVQLQYNLTHFPSASRILTGSTCSCNVYPKITHELQS